MDPDFLDYEPADLASFEAVGKPFYRKLGRRVTALRKRAGVTQAALAGLIGVAQQAIFAYEIADRRIPVDRVVQLARIFRITTDELLGVADLGPAKPRLTPELMRLIEITSGMARLDRRLVVRIAAALASQHNRTGSGATQVE